MSNTNIFTILVGVIILTLLAFALANGLLFVPSWLNYTMAGVELLCLIFIIYGRFRNFKNLDASLGIALNIFLLLLLIASMILVKSSKEL